MPNVYKHMYMHTLLNSCVYMVEPSRLTYCGDAGTGLSHFFQRTHHPFISKVVGKRFSPFAVCNNHHRQKKGEKEGKRQIGHIHDATLR